MAAATLTLLVLTLTGQVVELRADKPFLDSTESARLEVRVRDAEGRPARDASVMLSVNVGSVTAPVLEEEGVFRATWRPPGGEEPQVAVFHARVERGGSRSVGWLALPVHGRHLLRVRAPPRARVRVSVGGATFGPVVAGANGEVSVPVEFAPGVSSAQVTAVERSGRSRTWSVPLPSSEFARVWLVAPPAPPGGGPVRLQGFAVDERGGPAVPLPPLAVSVERGALGLIEAREGGAFEVVYTAPRETGSPVAVSASALQAPEQPFTLQLEPAPPPEVLTAGADEERTRPGRGEDPASVESRREPSPWQPSVGLFLLTKSNLDASTGLGVRLEGALRLAGLPLEALVQLEGRRNREELRTFSEEGMASLEKVFTLQGGGARLGARWSHLLGSQGQGVLFADATAGVLRMTGSVRLAGLGDVLEQQVHSLGPQLAVGGGLGWRVGAGRLCGQVQWAYAPGQGTVRGNLGGLTVALGYQLPLGGGVGP
jgi:hypothetical protein